MSNVIAETEAAFARAMAAFFPEGAPSKIGVAVSGGGDSMALLSLAASWADNKGQVFALSVNHGLRPEAEDEIALVEGLCDQLGICHEIADWSWDGNGNLQDAARNARRDIFRHWQDRCELSAVALGHTCDDVAETVLMRLARGSGVDGLAGMPAQHRSGTLNVIRPMLDLARQNLRDYLRAKDIDWADDPTNQDTRFDRVKARQMLETLAPLGLTIDRLGRLASHMSAAREVLQEATLSLAGDIVTQDRGDLLIDRSGFLGGARDSRLRLLAAALGWVSGAPYRPRFDNLKSLSAGEGRSTLHGCLISARGDQMRITREHAAVAGLSVTADQIWDGRWRMDGPQRPGLTISALGEAGVRQCPAWRDCGLPRESLLASPAVWRADTLIAAPLAGDQSVWKATLLPQKADFLHSLRLMHDYRIEPRPSMSI